jgi:hypothetical protein
MRKARQIVGVVMLSGCMAAGGTAHAAPVVPTAELSPDTRPVLVVEPPPGELLLVRHVARLPDRPAESLVLKLGHWIVTPVTSASRAEHRAPLPAPWRTSEADRGFTQGLLMQLSHVAGNSPWRTLIVSGSHLESDSQLQTLGGRDAVLAVVHDELVDLDGKVEFHMTLDLVTVRSIATARERRVHLPVQYFAPALAADSGQPRRYVASFAMDGALDDQVSTAATDLSQFLATIVARVSVPQSLHPHNPTLAELGVHPSCGVCRPTDPVVYSQPERVWVRVRAGKAPGSILSLPLQSLRSPASRTEKVGPSRIP